MKRLTRDHLQFGIRRFQCLNDNWLLSIFQNSLSNASSASDPFAPRRTIAFPDYFQHYGQITSSLLETFQIIHSISKHPTTSSHINPFHDATPTPLRKPLRNTSNDLKSIQDHLGSLQERFRSLARPLRGQTRSNLPTRVHLIAQFDAIVECQTISNHLMIIFLG